jgi:exonuclease III
MEKCETEDCKFQAAIWSKWPIKEKITTFDKYRTTCALIDAPFGELLVYATIIPYHNAGVIDGGKYAYAPRKYKAWEMHKENILLQGADWLKISSEYRDVPFVVAGDFNQTRDKQKYGYGTKITRELLTTVLAACNLSCLTEEDFDKNEKLQKDPKKGYVRKNIDHICVSKDWAESLKKKYIGAWDHFNVDGTYMSDHNGVYLEFTT